MKKNIFLPCRVPDGLLMKWISLVLCVMFIFVSFQSMVQAEIHNDWLGNSIGENDVVLPGYDSIEKTSRGYRIGLREIVWGKSLFPEKILVNGELYLNAISLRGLGVASDVELVSEQVNQGSVIVVTRARYSDGLEVSVTTNIEYDGMLSFDMAFSSRQKVKAASVSLLFDVINSDNTRVIGFPAKDIRVQKSRHDMLSIPYEGDFLYAVGIADGSRAIWSFVDSPRNRTFDSSAETKVSTQRNGNLLLSYPLLRKGHEISLPYRINHNILVTPVRTLKHSWRSERILWGNPSKKEVAKKGKFKMWWPNGFAFDAFPYVEYPEGVDKKLPKSDVSNFPGVKQNRALVIRDRENYGISWLPYFSAHVLSRLDPVLREYESEWRIAPQKTFKDGVGYSNSFAKPVLTHNAKGYSDYLLWRISELIDKLDIDGIYLDHGPPHDSLKLNHGAWVDQYGKTRPALDILSMRSFLKRLRTLFHMKGKPGYIFIHNSNREIIPAYTFAYGTIDGEQYVRSLKDGDYLDIVSVDEFRTRFANKQYGVVNYWLPVEWTNHVRDKKDWYGSESQKISYRRTKGIALLHDVPIWPQGSHRAERKKILGVIDTYGYRDSEFVGYWEREVNDFTVDSRILISRYRKNDRDQMIVVFNKDRNLASFNLTLHARNIEQRKYILVNMETRESIPVGKDGRVKYKLSGRDFALLNLQVR